MFENSVICVLFWLSEPGPSLGSVTLNPDGAFHFKPRRCFADRLKYVVARYRFASKRLHRTAHPSPESFCGVIRSTSCVGEGSKVNRKRTVGSSYGASND